MIARILQVAVVLFVLSQLAVRWWYERPVERIEGPAWVRLDPAGVTNVWRMCVCSYENNVFRDGITRSGAQ